MNKQTEALKLALETAEGIANSDWRKWEALASPEEFERWVKSRALHMATAIREALAEQPDPSAYWHNEFLKHNTTSEKPAQDQGQSCYCPECERLSKELDAIKSQQQEPVYWQWRRKDQPWSLEYTFNSEVHVTTKDSERRALYTTPPQRTWVGLTDEETIKQANKQVFAEAFARGAIWAGLRLKEKNARE